ncbi:hypothetical protein PpBr36_07456 [Pyricularia pennisetigena]|uniref:hypothetical protein n=1 Tax=Pyricularia pennisetigena TaxID=1578925 RepID=UPI0011508C99|nr:hypothetical protein PpBr36_07456 [Pyricularia pennisetigena]TLS25965.1 hypothetical protein PpBr36_07456 [Pyricularia pennisetigena]
MPSQVRIFTRPKPLAETLAEQDQDTVKVQQPLPRRQLISMSNNHGGIPEEGGITFAAQDSLPKLPIPDLERTCEKYLAALKPLQSPREHGETQHAVHEFLKHDGPELQEKLKKYAEGQTSYIEQFWYDSYLNFDNPVVLNLNPFFLLEDDPTPARNNQVTRAASLVVSALEFVRAVRKEELPPDKVKNTPLCMYQYSRLFGTARVPTENGCQIEQDPHSKHIVVMAHGQFYWFDALDDNSDVIMTEKDISINLQTIVDDASLTPIQEAAKGALGVLSTENRKVWSGLRDILTRDKGSNNADCLGIIDSALFILCLDYTEPATAAALCQNMLCGTSEIEKGVQIGTCTNRWYDKLQIIVCKNGSAGINFEHTGVDGHTVLRFASDVYTDTILRFARTINGHSPTLWASTSPDPSKRDPESFGDVMPTPHKLEWDLVPEVSIAVRFAETRLADLIGQNEFECLDFSAYGKNFITSMGFSPDAFVQMAYQAAYYGLYGRAECTYEPAMTKFFLHGRTEAVRSVTDESINFIQTFWADNPAEAKVEALRTACKKHVSMTKDCAKGQGCDRHLYALFCLWQRLVDEDAGTTTNGYSSGMSDNEGAVSERSQSPAAAAATTTATAGAEKEKENSDGLRSRGDSTSSSQRSVKYATLPLIFADPGWDKLNTTILSTSNCGNPSLRQFGFGPVSGDGFGIGYIIKDERISMCVASKHRQTKRFVDALESYLLEIRRILRLASRRADSSAADGGPLAGSIAEAKQQTTRAREVDDEKRQHYRRPWQQPNRLKSRGRMIAGPGMEGLMRSKSSLTGTTSPTTESVAMSEDDELGGYGFFDAGMLLQALKARNTHFDAGETRASERAAVQARRNNVGKKLRLIDY